MAVTEKRERRAEATMITPAGSSDTTMYSQRLRGLSTDTKPTEGIPNGSSFLEMDTGNVYMWDDENKQWRQL